MMVFDSVVYQNVVFNGLVFDVDGNKMFKSKGNVVDFFGVIEEYGVDVVCWYMMVNVNFWDNFKFFFDGVGEVQWKFFGILYNIYFFFLFYVNIDQFDNSKLQLLLVDCQEIDCWIISLFNSLVKEVDEDYSNYELIQVVCKIQIFVVDNLSNWYVCLCCCWFWKLFQQQNGKIVEMDVDKFVVYQIFYECLVIVLKLLLLIFFFFGDWFYWNFNQAIQLENYELVYLVDFLIVDMFKIDKFLEQCMDYVQWIFFLIFVLCKKEDFWVWQFL